MDASIVPASALVLAALASAFATHQRLRVRALSRGVRSLTAYVAQLGRDEAGTSPPAAPDELRPLSEALEALAARLRDRATRGPPERVFEQALVRETPNGLLVVDGLGVVRIVNQAARELLPWPQEPVGKRAIEVLPLPELTDALREASGTREIAERSARVGKRDLLLRGVPMADGAGTLGVILDITSVLAAERLRREFVSNVSHELRTPVTAIVGYAESLAEEPLAPEARRLLSPIVRNALRLSRLCEDVLALSRLEARAGGLPVERVELLPAAEEVISVSADRAAAKRMTVRLEGQPVAALANADALNAALQNLVDNALKYTPEGGLVRVVVGTNGARATLAVIDNGPGIDPVHHARLFERFYRVDPGRSRDAGGTGLGLSLVKHYCTAMGGEASMTSVVGAGSTFTLSLPVA